MKKLLRTSTNAPKKEIKLNMSIGLRAAYACEGMFILRRNENGIIQCCREWDEDEGKFYNTIYVNSFEEGVIDQVTPKDPALFFDEEFLDDLMNRMLS